MADLTDLAEDLETLRQARAEKAKWADVEEAMEEKIKTRLGNDPEGYIDGRLVVTWSRSDQARIDATKVRELLPPEVVALVTTLTTRRTFKIKDD